MLDGAIAAAWLVVHDIVAANFRGYVLLLAANVGGRIFGIPYIGVYVTCTAGCCGTIRRPITSRVPSVACAALSLSVCSLVVR